MLKLRSSSGGSSAMLNTGLPDGSELGSVGRAMDDPGGDSEGDAEDDSTTGLDDGMIGLDEISSTVGTQAERKQMANSAEITETRNFFIKFSPRVYISFLICSLSYERVQNQPTELSKGVQNHGKL